MSPYFISPLILQKLIWIPTRLILKFFGHLEIYGLENLDNLKTNAIFACNHTSEMDPFFVPASLGFFSRFSPIFYTSREKAFYANCGWRQIFYGGLFFKTLGSYPVFPGHQNYEVALANHIRIVNDGGNVVIYPEGGTTKDGNLKPAKGGVTFLAEHTGKPIIPVSVSGLFGLTIRDFLLRRSHFIVNFGRPIYIKKEESVTSGGQIEKVYKDTAQQVMNIIGKNLIHHNYMKSHYS